LKHMLQKHTENGLFQDLDKLSLDNSKDFYWSSWDKLKNYFWKVKSGSEVMKLLTNFTDRFISRLYSLASQEYLKKYPNSETRFVVIATGGYGRGELNPFSDVDFLFLVPFKLTPFVESVAERVYYTLWDTGLIVGYGLRSIDEAISLGLKDDTIRTSMLDHRFLFGDRELYRIFREKVVKKLTHHSTKSFVKSKLREMEERRQKYGGTLFLLEPEVKNGVGGLRDVHTAWWISKVRYKIEEWNHLYQKGVVPLELIDEMKKAREFIWKIRNFLHFYTRRKTDLFDLSLQHDAAEFFGYEDDQHMFASEKLMKDYYRNSSILKEFSDYIVKRAAEDLRTKVFIPKRKVIDGFVVVRDYIHIPGKDFLLEDQRRFLKVFLLLEKLNLNLDLDSYYLLKKTSSLIDDILRNDTEAGKIFMEILSGDSSYPVLQMMHDLKVLDNYIPEFAHLFGLIQHDVYHIYTADTHLLFAVNEMEKLLKNKPESEIEEEFKGVLESVENKSFLKFVILFHDIGKGLGGNHSEEGARLIYNIATRIGLDKELAERASLLIREHLTLINFALRRDLNDKNLIKELVNRVGDEENLSMLLVLSYADLKSVRPDEFTGWKLSLMFELYRRALFMIESGDESGEWLKKWAKERIEKTCSLLPEKERRIFREIAKEFPRRFFLSLEPEKIREIFFSIERLSTEPVQISIGKGPFGNLKSMTVITDAKCNRRGLFADISGVLRAFNCNIIEAQIYTLKDGRVVDIFYFYIPDEMWSVKRKSALIEAAIRTIKGEENVEELISKRQSSLLKSQDYSKTKYPAKIIIDNKGSKHFTIVELVALDKPGLLYSITKVFADMDLDINYARISSFGPKIADIFYVTFSGKKIKSREIIDSIIANMEKIVVEGKIAAEVVT